MKRFKLFHKDRGDRVSAGVEIDSTNTASPDSRASTIDETFPDGPKVWVPNSTATVDICFIHGLTGNRDSTWTAAGHSEPWPKTLLPAEVESARILTFGYDAYVARLGGVASHNTLSDHAKNLLHDLARDRRKNKAEERPLLFVAHSLGGLVCKQAILLSRNNPEVHLRNVFKMVRGIVFLGTPHKGAWLADWARIPANAIGIVKSTNKSLLDVLSTDNEFLRDLQDRFLKLLRELSEDPDCARQIKVTCFYEELGLSVIGKIVSKDSATFEHYDPISIHGNHETMVKFATSCTGFQRVAGELARWEAECSSPNAKTYNGMVQSIEKCSHEVDRLSLVVKLLALPDSDRSRKSITAMLAALQMEDVILGLVRNPEGANAPEQAKHEEAEKKIKGDYSAAVSRCLRSFSFGEMGHREAVIREAAKDTCQWIDDAVQFKRWSSAKNALLWIKGNPGSGKSTLMKSLARKRQLATRCHEKILLTFFFNARGSNLEKTQVGLYKTLVHQLLEKIPILTCEVVARYVQKERRLPGGRSVDWHIVEIADLFHGMIENEPLYEIEILVDALDECHDDEVRDTVRRFEDSVQISRTCNAALRICWSSRFYPHISLRSTDGLELFLKSNNATDIYRVVEREFPVGSDNRLRNIRSDLLKKAQDIFLWAVLTAKTLAKAADAGKSSEELELLLQNIPQDLNALFERTITESKTTDQERGELIIFAQWVLCSGRPLTPEELHFALKVQNVDHSFSLTSLMESMTASSQFQKRITDVSCGLFEVVWAKGNAVDSGRVQVIHESVREFFLGLTGLRLLHASCIDNFFLVAHHELAIVCFRTLLATDFDVSDQALNTEFRSLRDGDLEALTHYFPATYYSRTVPFLSYISDFTFEHFDRARKAFTNHDSQAGRLSHSAGMRKIALLNYLRLAYAEVNQHGSLWFKFNDQMQKASKEPLLFALASDNMEKLINFPKNVLLASTFLEARDVFMFGEHEKDALLDDKQRFLAIFCTIEPNLDRECLRRVLGTPNSTGVDASTLESSELFSRIRKQMQFLFALPFTVPTSLAPRVFIPGRLDEGAIKHRNDVVFPVSVYDWLIIDHVDQFKLPECVGGLLNQLMKYRISDSTATGCVCLLFHFDPGETAIVPDPANFSEIPCQSVGYGISSIWWMASGTPGKPQNFEDLMRTIHLPFTEPGLPDFNRRVPLVVSSLQWQGVDDGAVFDFSGSSEEAKQGRVRY